MTPAGKSSRRTHSSAVDLSLDEGKSKTGKKRLRMRPEVPIVHKGKKVTRKEIFEESDDEDHLGIDGAAVKATDASVDENDEDSMTGIMGGGFSITGDVEDEYQKMMQESQSQLQIMRTPSADDSKKRSAETANLKKQLDAWNSLVEYRIHLEGSLSIGHRLPVGGVAETFKGAETAVVSNASKSASQVREILGSLLSLQQRLASSAGTPIKDPGFCNATGMPEAEIWSLVDTQLQEALDMGLQTAENWKEHTRLDVKRSFKVLDQSLGMQMQAVAELPPKKLRRRCTPPPDRHKIFGGEIAQGAATVQKGDTAKGDGDEEAVDLEGNEVDIFDDRDFYVQLLREILGSKDGSGGLDSERTRELQAEVQGRRAAKKRAQADVERRASKGRKIRYTAIEKLQNFMASRPRSDVGNTGFDPSSREGRFADEALLRALFSRG